jgi:DNA-binding MarR family transcriptional regulator
MVKKQDDKALYDEYEKIYLKCRDIIIRNTYFETLIAIEYLEKENKNYQNPILKITKKTTGALSNQINKLQENEIVKIYENPKDKKIQYITINYSTIKKIYVGYLYNLIKERVQEFNLLSETYKEKLIHMFKELNSFYNVNIIKQFLSNPHFDNLLKSQMFVIANSVVVSEYKVHFSADILQVFDYNLLKIFEDISIYGYNSPLLDDLYFRDDPTKDIFYSNLEDKSKDPYYNNFFQIIKFAQISRFKPNDLALQLILYEKKTQNEL